MKIPYLVLTAALYLADGSAPEQTRPQYDGKPRTPQPEQCFPPGYNRREGGIQQPGSQLPNDLERLLNPPKIDHCPIPEKKDVPVS